MADRNSHFPRLLTPVIQEALADTPVICVLGPRQSGKTTLVRQLSPDRTYISLDEQSHYEAARLNPDGFVQALPNTVTLDEVQRVPNLLHAIKLAIDRNRRPGRFLLTGSANLLLLGSVSESLAGRMEIAQLHPLTEAEKEHQPGRFIADLLNGTLKPRITHEMGIDGFELPERLVAGGYPEPLTRTLRRARQWHRQYVNSVIERDVRDVAKVRDAYELVRMLELLSLRNAQLFNASRFASDLGLHRDTVERYVGVLERLFLVRRLPAWHGNRAKRLIRSPKAYLLDSGLAATLADLSPADWADARDLMGHLLEAFVVQQLVAQAAWTDPHIRFWHYRDKDQVEVDVVMTRGRRTWGMEIKASTSVASRDGRGLARLADQCGADFEGGILFHTGRDILPMRDKRMLAVPISELWQR